MRIDVRHRASLAGGTVLTALLTVMAAVAAEPDSGHVLIRLRPTAEVVQPVVLLSALADVSGGNEQLRQQIVSLDVAELMDGEDEAAFSSARVLARLALAGISPDDYEITGAETVHVTLAAPLAADERILQTVQRAVGERFNVSIEDVQIRLRSPLSGRLVETVQRRQASQLDVELPDVVRLGACSVWIRIPDESGLQSTWPVAIDVELRQPVIVATRPLPAGSTLTTSDIASDERYVSEPVERIRVDDVVGRSTRGAMYPGEILSQRDLTAPRPTRAELLVRPRDNVRMVARIGAVEVTVSTAEVLQAGAEGDLIRVRNSDSGKIVVGRIVTAELIEVPL